MPGASLTKSFADTTAEPGIYRDTKLAGFVLRILPSGKKVYAVMRKVRGSQTNITVTIGPHGVISSEQARLRAKEIISQMGAGVNPNDLQKDAQRVKEAEATRLDAEARVEAITLRTVADDYLRTRQLKSNTQYIYRLLINRYLGDWLDMPVTDITKDMVAKRHTALSEHKAQANHIMRILRALLTYASAAYEDADGRSLIIENPVRRLSQTKAWHRIGRRQTIVKGHDLKNWYSAVSTLENDSIRDYLIVLLLTGLRKNEGALLTWRDVDLQAKTLLIKDTKNHEDHMLPLTEPLYTLMLRRWRNRAERDQVYVFGMDNAKNYIYDCRDALNQIEDASGVKFMLHDLRRTFLTTAEELDTPHYALKRLANHKMSADVTAGYIVADVERLRQPLEKINAELLARCGVRSKIQRSIVQKRKRS